MYSDNEELKFQDPQPNLNPNSHKKSHPFLAKLGTGAACGVAFGLAAALVFAGIVKASGLDTMFANAKAEDAKEESIEKIFEDEAKSEEVAKADEKKDDDTDKEPANKDEADTGRTLAYTGEPSEIKDIVEEAMPSVVSITNKGVEEVMSMFGTRAYESTSVGSGIIIGENDEELLVATNNHVVAGANELSVCFGDDENKVVSANVKGTDPDNDLAIVAIKKSDLSSEIQGSYKIARIGSSSSLSVGDQVIAIGNALGYGQSVTTGIVSALDREVTIEGVTARLIQTDAAINPGNSGGALYNMNGELIGINSSKFASTMVEGMGYAIPIDTAQPILSDLMSRKTRDEVDADKQGYLGIKCQDITDEISKMYDIPKGVYITEVVSGGAAEGAGIKKGDVITGFDGVSIADYDELMDRLKYYEAGETVTVEIQVVDSDGEYTQKEVKATLVENSKVKDGEREDYNRRRQQQEQTDPFFDDLFFYGF